MGKLTVVVESMALWIERDSYWEVLFVDIAPARKRLGTAASPEEPHHPGLTFDGTTDPFGLPTLASARAAGAVHDLANCILDLTRAGIPPRPVGAEPDWMIPIPLSIGCIALERDAATHSSITAAIRLPFGPLEKAEVFPDGLVELPDSLCGGAPRYVYTDAGTVWQAEVDWPRELHCIDRSTGVDTTALLGPTGGGSDVTLAIVNETSLERTSSPLARAAVHGEALTELLDLFVVAGIPSTARTGVYKGKSRTLPVVPASPLAASLRAAAGRTLLSHTGKPCPQAIARRTT